jgi:4-hydroxy-tetrahydrodipicolinate synthase
MNSKLPRGVYAAVLTPQREDLTIDTARFAAHCSWLLDNGCDGLAIMGTTGEANSFTVGERIAALDGIVEAGVPPDKLMVGTGCCAIPDTVELTRHALGVGAGGVLMLPPFYYKQPDDEGVFRAFARTIETVNDDRLCVILYHFPKMTGVPFSDSVVERLIGAYPEVVAGMKDSSGDWEHMERLCRQFPDFRMYAGTEKYLLSILKIGGAGCISASTNLTCPQAGLVYRQWLSGGIADAENTQAGLTELRSTLEKYPFVSGLKHAMATLSGDGGWRNMRPPNVPLDTERAEAVTDALAALGFPVGITRQT